MVKLKALYDVEKELVKALPKMAKKASDGELKTAFQDHLKETEVHVDRLEECFELLDVKPAKLKVEAIRGLIADAEWAMGEKPSPQALDSILIASASYVENYEMAGYVSASRWARMLDYAQAAELLEETLQEEQAADKKLSGLAESSIDEAALGIMDDEDMNGEESLDNDAGSGD